MNKVTSYDSAAQMLSQINERHGQNVFKWIEVEDLVNRISLKYSFSALIKLGYIQRILKGKYRILKVMPMSVISHDLRELSRKENAITNARRSRKKEFVIQTYYAGGKKHELFFNDPSQMPLIENSMTPPQPLGLANAITPAPSMTDEQMIAHLKSKGYKIMKPVQQFEEI